MRQTPPHKAESGPPAEIGPDRTDGARAARSALLTFAAVTAGVFRGVGLPLNHDAAWFLHLSSEVLRGQRLYVDLIEVNPPLIVWLGIPAILAERWTAVPAHLLVQLCVGLLGLAALALCFRLLEGLASASLRWTVTALLAIGLFIIPSSDWGQREHILLILLLPYVLAAAALRAGRSPRNRTTIGFAAGIGLALKPHFLLILAAVELWLMLSRRRLSSMGAIALTVIAVYSAAVLVITPEYLPMMRELRAAYTAFSAMPIASMLMHPTGAIAAAAVLAMVLPGEGRELRTSLGLLSVTGWLIFVVQAKGFFYHAIPLTSAAFMLTAATLVLRADSRNLRATAEAVPFAVIFATVVALVLFPPWRDPKWAVVNEIRAAASDQRIIVLSSVLRDPWPGVRYANANWVAPAPAVWPMRAPGAQHLAASWFTPALETHPVVLVPTDPRTDGLPLLLESEEFRAAWSSYRETSRGIHFRVYRNWQGIGNALNITKPALQ